MSNYLGTARFLIEKIEVVVRKSSYMPFYKLKSLDGSIDTICGGVLVPKDDEGMKMAVTKEQTFINSLFIDGADALNFHKSLGREVITLDCNDSYTSVDFWDTEEGNKACLGGSVCIYKKTDDGKYGLLFDDYMIDNMIKTA